MDSVNSDDQGVLKIWKVLFGGDNLFGRLKLYLFLVAFNLIGGLTLAHFA